MLILACALCALCLLCLQVCTQHVEIVLTAHPTQVNRRTLQHKFTRWDFEGPEGGWGLGASLVSCCSTSSQGQAGGIRGG